LAGLVGFGGLSATGYFAARCGRVSDAFADASIRQFFRPGRNYASRAIFAVPLLGAVLLAMGKGADLGHFSPWIGLGLWLCATGLATGIIWPSERSIQQLFDTELDAKTDRAGLLATARRCEQACALTSVIFVVAFIVMVLQPS
jgi:hypothetical protein